MDAKSQHRVVHAPRVEDDVLVRGRGRYVADLPLPNQAHAYFVRSPHAFARIVSVDVEAALRAPARPKTPKQGCVGNQRKPA